MEAVETEKSIRFQIGEFEGPLDVLLFLIRKNEINIYDIPIARITEQFLAFLSLAVKIDLEKISAFYLMAADLLLLKCRMLLPVEVDLSEDFEDPRKELVDKLIEYQRIKKLSEMMGEKEREAEWVVERKNKQRVLPFADENLWEEIEVWDLLKAFSELLGKLSIGTVNLFEEVTVNEKLTLIQEFLDNGRDFLFTDLIIRPDSIMDVICAFLSILEAVKSRMIRIFQNTLFGDIRIAAAEKKQEDESGNRNGADRSDSLS
ncbi:MAG: segregation/condensation protein A [Spirochaetales bacterium]|jgi:segregation and condensation protein A|nr:segregation/condensation protein A [Spirochaetales bacterium]